jgi:subtilisin
MNAEQTIARDGHAQVLVILKPAKRVREAGRMALDLGATRHLQAETAHTLEKHFARFQNARQVVIAREVREHLKSAVGDLALRLALDVQTLPRAKAVRVFPNLGIMLGTVDADGLRALEAEQGQSVASVSLATDPDLIRPQISAALGAVQPTGISWGIRRIKADELWNKGLTGKGVLIGHVDTGVDASHPALKNGIDAFAEFDRTGEQVPAASESDSGRHGTHTAGILVGRKTNGLEFGVAPGAKLASAMVIEGGTVSARLLGGLDWCVGQGVRIVNMSLGFRGYDAQFEAIIDLLRDRNIIPVVAIGNEGPLTSRSPGNYRHCFSIGAMDENDQIWIDSSSQKFGPPKAYTKPDIIAPGADIWSSVPRGGLLAMSGTSMATPHIAGLAALLVQHRPDIPSVKIEQAIIKSATRPKAIASARGNKGVPDGLKALALLP